MIEPEAGRWRTRVALGRLSFAFLVFAIWKITADAAGPLYVAGPGVVFRRLVDGALSGELWPHILATLQLAATGFVAGFGTGAALPLLLYAVPRLTDALEPFIVASGGIPKYAVVPLFILWFGIDTTPKLCLVALLVFYPVFIAVLAGIRNVDRALVNTARILGAGRFALILLVVWPSMLSFVFGALRIAVPRAVGGAVIGELLVGEAGVGYLIERARQNLDTTGVFIGLILATLLVVTATILVQNIERRTLASYGIDGR